MIDLEDHHLIMLMEECAEVAHRASKQLRFGSDEVQPGQDLSNRQRLREEILDMFACVEFLVDSGQIGFISREDIRVHLMHKREKINRMLALSQKQGRLAHNGGEGNAS